MNKNYFTDLPAGGSGSGLGSGLSIALQIALGSGKVQAGSGWVQVAIRPPGIRRWVNVVPRVNYNTVIVLSLLSNHKKLKPVLH